MFSSFIVNFREIVYWHKEEQRLSGARIVDRFLCLMEENKDI